MYIAKDEDDDNDGFADEVDGCPQGMTGVGNDLDSDGCQDSEDPDIDGDGVLNENCLLYTSDAADE